MRALFSKLRRTGLLSTRGVLGLLRAIRVGGANPMVLLAASAERHPDRVALVDEHGPLTYRALWTQADALARQLRDRRGIRPGAKVALACANHAELVKAIFALARLGARITLLSPDLRDDQLVALDARHGFEAYIHDETSAPFFTQDAVRDRCIPARGDAGAISIARLAAQACGPARLPRGGPGEIVVMTGGTTGQPKAARRKPSVLAFLSPFTALLTQIHLDQHRRLYVATPIYHGYGIAALMMGVMLGAEIHVARRFDAARARALIAHHQVECVTLVPLMLRRLLQSDVSELASLRCIVCGSAPLDPVLARETTQRLGPLLFNLYGTSEGGVAIMADPASLQDRPESIGRPLPGVRIEIRDDADRPLGDGLRGRLFLRSAWTSRRHDWIDTGDLARRDADGRVTLFGRSDDMIVSGGENVYPIELENALLQHPGMAFAAVVGIADLEFGQRLKAFVVARDGHALDPASLAGWLKPRVERHQMPVAIEVRAELPFTPLGKPDKRALGRQAAVSEPVDHG